MPETSVITCTYNRSHLLPRAIESVLQQTYTDFELLIVDDGSTDDTPEVVRDYEDERIRYLRHETNKGSVEARNNGIRNANGEFIAILDDDDKWELPKLEKQLTEFRGLSDEYGLVYSGRKIHQNDSEIRYRPFTKGDIFRPLLRKNMIPSETVVARKKCFEDVGTFDPMFSSCIDWDMWLRIARKYKVSYVNDVLAVTHRDSPNRQSDDYERKLQGHQKIYEKHRDELEKDQVALGNHHMRVGIDLLNLDDDRCSKHFKKSFFLNKRNKTSLVLFVISKLPRRKKIFRWLY